MSEPDLSNEAPLQGAVHELISGMSALNMQPCPIEPVPEGAVYLSERDYYVKHAMEHFSAAARYLGKENNAQSRIGSAAARLLWALQDRGFPDDDSVLTVETTEELVAFLDRVRLWVLTGGLKHDNVQ
jgi:hypothetical protein